MISRKLAPEILAQKGEAVIKAAGNSMRPIIRDGDAIYLKKVDFKKLRKGDAVFCKVNGNKVVHLISAIDSGGERFQISNNFGRVNGWINDKNIYGICIRVEDKIIVSEEELDKR